MQPVQKNNCIAKPGIERLLFLAVAFEPATVDSRELYLRSIVHLEYTVMYMSIIYLFIALDVMVYF